MGKRGSVVTAPSPGAARQPEWLLPHEAGRILRVDPKTITRWVNAGTIPREHWFRTPAQHGSGHIRIRAAWVDAYVNGDGK
jgi:hypothetical protein